MKYCIVTYGCQMNVHESEKIAGILENMGYYTATETREEADIIVFNTCAIREGACERAFGNIGALKKMKKQRPELIIVVCGCMSQKETIANDLFKKFPFIDLILGTFNVNDLQIHLEQKKRHVELLSEGYITEGLPYKRTSGENAWVNIMFGCDNFCTYCIVPYVRGREKSRTRADILEEIKSILKEGKYKRITLLGQNVNSYGNDSKENGSFANLLSDICKLDGDFEIAFMTSHPKDITSEVIDVVASEKKIVKEIHLPMQSGSNKILELMNRKYTKEKYFGIIEEIKTKIPKVRLTSDFIVGFPGETEEDFNETCDALKKVEFDGIFAFMYSVREGTVAEKMDGHLADEVKRKRVNELLKLEKKIQREKECKKS